MLIEWTRPNTGAAKTKYHWTSLIGRSSEKFGLQSRGADGAFGPYLASTFCRVASDGAGQVTHHRRAGALLEGDDTVSLNSYRGSKLFGQEVT